MGETTRQPTWEELREKLPRRHGAKGLYAAPAGTGPAGKTCHSCAFLRYTDPQGRAKHPKCGKVAYTHGDATTIKTSTPACKHYEVDQG